MDLKKTGISKIRLMMADPHRLYAEAIEHLLGVQGIDVVAVCSTGDEALAAAHEFGPGLGLIDTGLPDLSAIDVGRQLAERHSMKVIVVAPHYESVIARQALDAGLHGFVTRQGTVKQLMASIHAVIEGNIVMPPRTTVDGGSASGGRNDAAHFAAAFHLTPRERDVLVLLLQGSNSKDMAKSLSLQPNTVRTHVQNVLTKLHVHSRLEAAAVANRMGLVDSEGRLTIA